MDRTSIISPGEALRQAVVDTLREISQRAAAVPLADADVHLARRAAKRARALARLAPARLEALARQTRAEVGAARRMLAGARDAQVRRATLDSLRAKLGGAHDVLAPLVGGGAQAAPLDPVAAAGEARGAVAEPGAAGSCEPDGAQADAAVVQASLAGLIRDWSLCDASEPIDAIIASATHAYRKARKRAHAAEGGGTEALHAWRSAVVDLEYHAAFLQRFAPAMKAVSADADRLRKHLGDINDLDELARYLDARTVQDDEARSAARRLRHASAARRARLLEKAQRLGERLLSRSPAHWADDLRKSCER